ncbi:MAG: hypothetical protein JWN40_3564 [Phycisphaerales bacterium]|nr:hypothetical protein [Phycisphaerales bacterium]
MLPGLVPIVRRIFEVSRSKWWQLVAGPLIAALIGLLISLKSWDGQLALTLVPFCGAVGFVGVALLLLRDAGRSLSGAAGVAGLTPSKFVGEGLASTGEFDEAAVLNEIVQEVGRPLRGGTQIWQMYRTPARTQWLGRGDLIDQIYRQYADIVHRGEVRWAAVIHANATLYSPGEGDAGAQVVYAPDGAPLARVRAWATACYAVKNTTPANPAVRRIADMLTDELERALNWPIPSSLCGRASAITTVVMLPRALLPLGHLTCPFFPVFADPVTKMAVLVPSGWWPAPLVNLWVLAGRGSGVGVGKR